MIFAARMKNEIACAMICAERIGKGVIKMKLIKTSLSVFLALIIALSSLIITTAASYDTKNMTITVYKQKVVSVKAKFNCEYSHKVTGFKKAVKVESYTYQGRAYYHITAKKLTETDKPTVKLIEKNLSTGKKTTLKAYKITVKDVKNSSFRAIKLSVGADLVGAVKNSYTRAYTLKIRDESIAMVNPKSTVQDNIGADNYQFFGFNTFRKGTTTADIYLYGTKKKVGTVKLVVGDYKPYVDSRFSTLTLKYNKHGLAEYNYGFAHVLHNYKYGAKLTYKYDTKYLKIKKSGLNSVIPKKRGTVKITAYAGDVKAGTFKVNIVKGTMAEVFANNTGGESDGDFLNYDDFIHISDGKKTFNLFNKINKAVLNNENKGTSFAEEDYTVTYKSPDETVATVDENGKVHAGAKASEGDQISLWYSLKFSDGSTFTDTFTLGFD